MRLRSVGLGLVLLCASASFFHCGSDANETPPPSATAVAGAYRGVLAGTEDLSGTLELTITSATASALTTNTAEIGPRTASGTATVRGTVIVNVPGIGSVTVDGQIDQATGNVSFAGSVAGGSITFTGHFEDGVLSGTFTSPWGAGSFSLTKEELGLRSFCGRFDGSASGRWNLYTAGSRAGGVMAGGGVQAGLLGTFDGSRVALDLRGISGLAQGTLAGNTVTGTWSTGAGQAGNFSVSEEECSALPPRSPGSNLDAGTSPDGGTPDGGAPDSGPSDGGSDAGGPDAGGPDAGGPDAGGAGPDIDVTSEQTPIDYMIKIGSRLVFAGYDTTYVGYVNTDGTGRTIVSDACGAGGCRGLVAMGNDAYVWDSLGAIRRLTPPGTQVSATLATLSNSPNAAESDGTRFLFFRNQGPGGFFRWDTTGSSSSNFTGFAVGGFQYLGNAVLYTEQGATNALRSLAPDFSATTNLSTYTEIAPDDVAYAVGGDATASYYFSTQTQAQTKTARLWAVSGGTTARMTTIAPNVVGTRLRVDATRVWFLNQNFTQGELKYVLRSTRNDFGSVQLRDWPDETVHAFDFDATYVYTAVGNRIVRSAKPGG